MLVCPSCGQPNPEGARFCNACASSLTASAPAREERKVVTVVFADLVGFTSRAETLDPEDVEAILRPYHERLRAELEQRGGTVEKFIGDAVMAVFGAPTTHEDDPERAVRAALAIRDGIVEDGTLEVRVGVNTGEALVNVDARPEAGESMVAGDVVNTAARLQAAAPTNGVIVGEATKRATERAIEYREHASVAAKGKADPVQVWEAVEARARVGVELRAPATPLVGRVRERELLLGAFERARGESSPQLVTIVGVPGIGKSRLVAELFDELEHQADITYWRHGRSLPYGEGVAFWAFAEMIKAHAGILDSDDAGDAARKLRDAVAAVAESDAAWVESRLRPLVGLDAADGARDESFAAWRRFVEALAEQRPTVLVFEDLHWADDDLLDFVDQLVEWLNDVPLLVVATARPELFDRRPGWGGGKRNALTVSLAPLEDDETARLLAGLLDRNVLPAETQQALLARAGGNPLYAEQFARMLVERGEIGELPETVQGIIAARLDSLSPDEKQLLLDAAVLGRTFWVGALEAIGGVSPHEAERLLHGLQRKEFVRRERRSTVAGETEFAFAHLVVRDVAYAQIPRAGRAERHVLAARWINTLAADRSEDLAELLVHHYLAAIDLARAAGTDSAQLVDPTVAALLEAMDRAAALSAYSQAQRFGSRALELVTSTDVRHARAAAGLAAAEYFLGVGSPELRAADAAAVFAAAGDLESAAEAHMFAARCWWNRGDRDEADLAAERALELMRAGQPSRAKVAVLVERSRLLMLRGEHVPAIELGREGLALAGQLGLERQRASALVTIGTALNGLDGSGVAELHEGLEIAERINAPDELQRAYNNLAEHAFAAGDAPEAMRLYDRSRERLEGLGLAGGVLWIQSQQAAAAWWVGDWERATSMFDGFIAVVEATPGHYLETQARVIRGHMAAARGDHEAALAELTRAREVGRAAKDPQALGPPLAFLARVLLDEGRTGDATTLVDELLTLQNAEGQVLYYTWLIMLAWLLHDLGRPGELPGPGRAAPWGDAAERIVRGDLAGAADVLAGMGMRTDEAYARLRAAERLANEGRSAEAQLQLEQALAFYRGVGATVYVRRGEALLPASA